MNVEIVGSSPLTIENGGNVMYIDSLASRYSGKSLAARLEFAANALASTDEAASHRALVLAVAARKMERDVTAYASVAAQLESLNGGFVRDDTWISQQSAANAAEVSERRAALDDPNLTRDVRRSGYIDFARFAISIGDEDMALRYLHNARDLSVLARQTSETTMAILALLVSRREWLAVGTTLSRSATSSDVKKWVCRPWYFSQSPILVV
jgi:hypothetical protein